MTMQTLSLLLLVTTARLAFVGANSCTDNMDSCVDKMRGFMLDDNLFWFGNDYHIKCSDDKQLECTNPNPSKTIFGRFFNTTSPDKTLAANLQLATVTFNTPKGSYYGCGNWTHVPAAYGFEMNPLEIVPLNSWSMDFTPSVTWYTSDDSALYTVIIWDVGYFYSHGLYVNCVGGRMDSGTAIDKYHGPKNPRTTANLFLFMVIKQEKYVEIATVTRAFGFLVYTNDFRLYPTLLIASMPGYWSDLVAANLMSAVGDSYSIQTQKDWFIVNNCPRLASQQMAVQTVMQSAKIPLVWSSEAIGYVERSSLYQELSPYILLTVDITVEYSSEEMTIESCCVKSKTTSTLYRVNPFSMVPSQPAWTRNQPRVEITPTNMMDRTSYPRDKLYTLMLVDMTDAVYRTPQQNYYLHWLVTDIYRADIHMGNTLVSYFGPNSFSRDIPRVYVFLLLEQDGTWDSKSLALWNYVGSNCLDTLKGRCEFQPADMIRDSGFTLAGLTWFMSVQDAYARKMIYETLAVQPMVNICDGLPGFEEPCYRPDPGCSKGPYPSTASVMIPNLVALTLIAFAALTRLF